MEVICVHPPCVCTPQPEIPYPPAHKSSPCSPHPGFLGCAAFYFLSEKLFNHLYDAILIIRCGNIIRTLLHGLMTGAPEYLAELERRMQKQFWERLSIYRSEPYFLEFMPPNVLHPALKFGKVFGRTRHQAFVYREGNIIREIRHAADP